MTGTSLTEAQRFGGHPGTADFWFLKIRLKWVEEMITGPRVPGPQPARGWIILACFVDYL